jgi:hypothetical protein
VNCRVPKPKARKRNPDEIKDFSHRKMNWLNEKCADPNISDHQFRFLYALLSKHYSNSSDWCDPKDETVGKSCAKSERTIQRISAELRAAGVIDKQKQLGPSHYSFPGLTKAVDNSEFPPHMAGLNETGPAAHGGKHPPNMTGNSRHSVAGQNPSLIPSLNPSLGNGSDTSPSPLNEASASSPKKGIQEERDEGPSITPEGSNLFETQGLVRAAANNLSNERRLPRATPPMPLAGGVKRAIENLMQAKQAKENER